MTLSFNPLAERELNEAAQFYEAERTGLGLAFIAEAERACQRILAWPNAAPIVRGQVRRHLLRRFPYALLYSIHEDTIRVLAIMNLKRRPMYWIGRTQP
jgi:hypothetical protein